MNERRITFSAEDRGVLTLMQQLRRSAEELGRSMIADARSYTTSGREVSKIIEEQIRAIERRNRIDSRSQLVDARNQFAAGRLNEDQYRARVQEIRRGTEEDKLQIQLLRELIETTRQAARDELRADRRNVEEQIQNSRTVDALSPQGDELDILRETVQRQELANTRRAEIEENFWSRVDQRKGAIGVNMFTGAVGAQNMYVGGASAMGQLPALFGAGILTSAIVGGLSSLVGRGFREAQGYERSLTRMSALSGNPYDMYVDEKYGRYLQNFGVTQEGYLNTMVETSRAQGYRYRRNKRGAIIRETTQGDVAVENLMATKAYDIDMGSLLALTRASRGERGGFNSASDRLQGLYGGMRRIGAASGDDKSLVPEYLQMLIQVNQEQNNILGKVNTNVSGGMILGIANMSSEFKRNPELLKSVLGGFQQGLSRSNIPQVEAMQLSVLSRMAPGQSYFKYREMMEEGGLLGNSKYASKFLESLHKQSGGNTELFADYISQTFFGGKNLRQSRLIAESSTARLKRGGDAFSIAGLSQELGVDLEKMAGKGYGTGILEKATTKTTNFFAQRGEELIKEIDDLVTGLGDFAKTIVEENVKARVRNDQILTEMSKSSSALQRIASWMMRAQGVGGVAPIAPGTR